MLFDIKYFRVITLYAVILCFPIYCKNCTKIGTMNYFLYVYEI